MILMAILQLKELVMKKFKNVDFPFVNLRKNIIKFFFKLNLENEFLSTTVLTLTLNFWTSLTMSLPTSLILSLYLRC